MQIKLYTNTAEPERVDKSNYLTTLATIDGTLKEQCSIEHPIITIDLCVTSLDVGACNYAYISAFGRYYYVNGRTYITNDMLRLDMDEDYLMSHKTGILSLNAFILRQENEYNPKLIDSTYPIESGATITYSTFSNATNHPWNDFGAFWNGEDTGERLICVEMLTWTTTPGFAAQYGMSRFCMTRTGFLSLIYDASTSLFIDAFSFIKKIYFLPYKPNEVSTDITQIQVKTATDIAPFNFNFSAGQCRMMAFTPIVETSWAIDIPARSSIDEYLNTAPYRSYQLRFMPFGSIELDADIMADLSKTKLWIKARSDSISGAVNLYVGVGGASSTDAVAQTQIATASVSVDLTAGAVYSSIVPTLSTVIGAGVTLGATIATGGGSAAIAGAAAGGLSGVASSLSNAGKQGALGASGSGLIDTKPMLITTIKGRSNDSITLYGKPCFKNLSLSSIHGFTKVGAIHLEGFSATEWEKNEIDTLLKTGVIL